MIYGTVLSDIGRGSRALTAEGIGDMALPIDPDTGALREFTEEEVESFEVETFEIEGGEHPTHRREFNSSTISAAYFVKYEKYEDFVTWMLGACKTYISGGVRKLSRLKPQTWPGKPNCAAIRIDSADGHQFIEDDNSGPFPVPTYDRMLVRLTFQELPFDVWNDDEPSPGLLDDESRRYWLVLPSQVETEYLEYPGGIMKLVAVGGGAPPGATAPIPVPQNIGIPLSTSTITRRWHRLPEEVWRAGSALYERIHGNPFSGEEGFIGTVNDAPFMGYQAGQLLLIGVEEEVQLDPVESVGRVWNLTYRWAVKVHGHNFFMFRPKADAGAVGSWAFATADGTYYAPGTLVDGKSVFNERSHKKLLEVGV